VLQLQRNNELSSIRSSNNRSLIEYCLFAAVIRTGRVERCESHALQETTTRA